MSRKKMLDTAPFSRLNVLCESAILARYDSRQQAQHISLSLGGDWADQIARLDDDGSRIALTLNLMHLPVAETIDVMQANRTKALDGIITNLVHLGYQVEDLVPYGILCNLEAKDPSLAAALTEDGATELWAFLESYICPSLPAWISPNVIILAKLKDRSSAHASTANSVMIKALPPSIDATNLPLLLGDGFASFQTQLSQHLRSWGALNLVVILDATYGPALPLKVDFLDLLDADSRARLLDQLAWRWTQQWSQAFGANELSLKSAPIARLLDYEVFRSIAAALKPLVKEDG